jgi:hypothetical protein
MIDFIDLNINDSSIEVVRDINYLPTNYRISLKYSKLIPYYIWRLFYGYSSEMLKNDSFINVPTNNVNTCRKPTVAVKHLLSYISTSSYTNRISNYVTVKIGNIRYPIFIRNHMIYTYDIIDINELNSASVDLKPILLLVLCNGRDQELYKKFNLETSVLLVNSDSATQHLMRPFNKYIKEYRENGVKNVLYTQNPNYYVFDNLIEKAPLMGKVKMNAYIEEFLPTNSDIVDTTTTTTIPSSSTNTIPAWQVHASSPVHPVNTYTPPSSPITSHTTIDYPQEL